MPSAPNQSQTFGEIRIDGQGNQLVVNQLIQVSREEVRAQKLNAFSPYLALDPFAEENARLFFGRNQLIGELLGKVKNSGFTLVAGASGSGKSSLVHAGLGPQLRAQLGPRLRVITLTPDVDPFESLRVELRRLYKSPQQKEMLRAAEPSAEDLPRWARGLRPPSELWLLILDQFEQIFTRTTEESVRAAFLDGVVRLAAARLPEVRVVATMRADFLDQIGRYPELARLAERNLLFATDMTKDELRAAIEQPAAQHGVALESGLVEQIISDVEGRPGALPLLQYTLHLLWEAESLNTDRELKAATYRQIGGVRGALEKRAQALYEFRDVEQRFPRSQEEQGWIHSIFLRLVDFSGTGDKARAVSRRVALSSFTGSSDQQLVAEFVEAKLLVTGRGEQRSGETRGTVEIAHEALLTAWRQLATWIEQGREAITLRNRLAVDAAQWQHTIAQDPGRAEEDLWSGTHLQAALELEQRGEFAALYGALGKHEQAFLQASRALSERREDEREERRLRRIQALQRELDGFIERGRLLLLDGRPTEAALWLVGAYERGSQHPMLPYLLRQAMLHVERVHAVLLGHTGSVRTIEYSRDGSRLVTASQDGTARVWDSQTGAQIAELRGHDGPVARASFDPSGERVVTASEDATARIWYARNGELLHALRGHSGPVTAADFHPNDQLSFSASEDATLRLWDTATGQLLKELRGHSAPIRCACFSPDGLYILSAGDDGIARLWAVPSGELLAALEGTGRAITSAVFNPDGSLIVAVAEDRSVRFWYTQTRTSRPRFGLPPMEEDHEDRICAFAWSPDGETIATASADGTAGLWSLTRRLRSKQPRLVGHYSRVAHVSFSSEGKRLCTASADGTIRMWDAETRRCLDIIQGPTQGFTHAQFSPDGQYLAAGSEDGTAWLWRVASPTLCAELGRPTGDLHEFELSADQHRLVTWGESDDGRSRARVWETASGACLASIDSTGAEIKIAQFSSDSSMLMLGYGDGQVSIHDATGQRDISRLAASGSLVHAELSSDGRYALTRCAEDELRVWEIATGRLVQTIERAGASLTRACFAPAGAYVLTASSGGMLRLFHRTTGARQATLREHTGGWIDITYSTDGSRLLVHNSYQNWTQMNRWKTPKEPSRFSLWSTGESLRRISSATLPPCNGVRLEPSGSSVACVLFSPGKVLIYDAETWLLQSTLEGHCGEIHDVQFSPDGARIATACRDDGVRIFETVSGKLLTRYDIRASYRLRFTGDGQRLVADCGNEALFILDVGSDARSSSSLGGLLRARVPYRLNGSVVAPGALAAWPEQPVPVPAAKFRYSDRRDVLRSTIHRMLCRDAASTPALWTRSSVPLAWFEDAEATAIQKLAELTDGHRRGMAGDELKDFNQILLILEHGFPVEKGRAEKFQHIGDLALCYLHEPGLAITAYEESLRLAEHGTDVLRLSLLAAQLCAGHYATVQSIADSFDLGSSSRVLVALLSWVASTMQRKSLALDHWAIIMYNVLHLGWHADYYRSIIISPVRRLVFQSDLASDELAQIVYVIDAYDAGVSQSDKDPIVSILERRQPVLQRVASGDFIGLLTDAEKWWPYISQLDNYRDRLWAVLFWSLALQINDPVPRLEWANRIHELCDGASLGLNDCDWLLPALNECKPPLRQWPTICRVFELLKHFSTDDRSELYGLLV